ncbi:type II toxin-antitoxin system RelE/ParE family toxin [Sphingomonas sp. SUN019]|uniref:type II toxin-antitoxin system RelE/ParE family toxin n=1 Tax=Sphingomonas sp. SUN019 TaxID=2937788 RepID=UPI0021642F8F|nr:type II toxin-antitoxin system RelE/ParE family toxin [Sphingomonas sp. SUN019]
MIVRFNAEAEDDLEAIADYIARDDPVRAVMFVREIRARCAHLPFFPERFPTCGDMSIKASGAVCTAST